MTIFNNSLRQLLIFCLISVVGCCSGCSRPIRSFGEVLPDTTKADRVVIRLGGHTCCVPLEKVPSQPRLCEITDPHQLEAIRQNMVFIGQSHPNSCMCCGMVALDWYKGTDLLAVTTVLHEQAIMKQPKEVIDLTNASQKWLRSWLLAHDIPAEAMR